MEVSIAVELSLKTEEGVGVLEEQTDVCQTALKGEKEMKLSSIALVHKRRHVYMDCTRTNHSKR